ncbi:YvrJ family protein [Paenibacillus sp. N3.4]|uniref:YvrJ family protein n=1 Tax=Paenibacillus sp. N3.4 TaxID=2603222 RepID=UPI0021C2D686|nr:YvrJ family protein [Paenibacillus sp. N3.4]
MLKGKASRSLYWLLKKGDDFMIDTDYIQIVSNVGFPIVVAGILLRSLLTSFHQRLDKLDATMNELLQAIKSMKSE